MKKYVVNFSVIQEKGWENVDRIVEAETLSKATYKVFKSEIGKLLSENAIFIHFLKYLHNYTTEIK